MSDSNQNDVLDFMKPQGLTEEDAHPSSGQGTINGRNLPKNPLLPGTGGGMAAFDGNQPFAVYSASAGDDATADDSTLDDLTIPKDPYGKEADDAPKPASNTAYDKSAQNNAGNGGNAAAAPADIGYTDDILNRADDLSMSPSVVVGGKWLSEKNFSDGSAYSKAIADALSDEASRNAANNASAQTGQNSQGVLKNPGPIPGLSKSKQAMVDQSYILAAKPSAEVNGQVTERSHYYDQDSYRRMILRDLFAEIHGGYDKILDSEAPLMNPQYDPNLTRTGEEIEVGRKILQNTLTGGAVRAAELPETVKSGYELLKAIFGDDN
jgi:hypothetical protein